MNIATFEGTPGQEAALEASERVRANIQQIMRRKGKEFVRVSARDFGHYEAFCKATGLSWTELVRSSLEFIHTETNKGHAQTVPHSLRKADIAVSDQTVQRTDIRYVTFDRDEIDPALLMHPAPLSEDTTYVALEAFVRNEIESPHWTTREDISDTQRSFITSCGRVALAARYDQAA